MNLIYCSDLHIRSEDSSQGQNFIHFLQEIPRASDTLILGGDIFDLLVGSKDVFKERFQKTFQSLDSLNKIGCKILYLEGNHDFHLEGLFAESKNISVKNNAFELEWAEKKLWIDHGDLIDPEDTGYRFLRALTRTALFRWFIRLIPGALVKAVGEQSSKTSRKYNNIEKINEEKRARARKLFLEFSRAKAASGYDFCLMGHSHIEDQTKIENGTRTLEYLNLGFSSVGINYAVLAPNQSSFEILNFKK